MSDVSDKPDSPPPPDIKRDRVVVMVGACMITIQGVLERPADSAPAWVTMVPVEGHQYEKDNPGKVYPHERHFRVAHELYVGTVDELVEDYRDKLTRCFDTLTMRRPDGGHDVIPSLGEASLRRQTEVLERHGLNRPGTVDTVGRAEFEARQQRRNVMNGFEPRQDAFERDALMRLVGEYRNRRRGGTGGAPTDSPGPVQQLIDALTCLRDDRVTLDRHRQEQHADKQIVIPARPCMPTDEFVRLAPVTRDGVADAAKGFFALHGKEPTRIHLTAAQIREVKSWWPAGASLPANPTVFGMKIVPDPNGFLLE